MLFQGVARTHTGHRALKVEEKLDVLNLQSDLLSMNRQHVGPSEQIRQPSLRSFVQEIQRFALHLVCARWVLASA